MTSSQNLEQITSKEDALRIARDYVVNKPNLPIGAILFLSKEPLTSLKTIRGSVPFDKFPEEGAWVAFIDLAPGANYAHPCEYLQIGRNKMFYIREEAWCPENWIEMFKVEEYR